MSGCTKKSAAYNIMNRMALLLRLVGVVLLTLRMPHSRPKLGKLRSFHRRWDRTETGPKLGTRFRVNLRTAFYKRARLLVDRGVWSLLKFRHRFTFTSIWWELYNRTSRHQRILQLQFNTSTYFRYQDDVGFRHHRRTAPRSESPTCFHLAATARHSSERC